MVAPGSVTSRLGSVFPFLLVLVDLQYEGKPCPGERSGLRGQALPALPCQRLGASLWAARAVGREPGTPRPGLGLSPPSSGFVWGRVAGIGGHGAGSAGLE